MNWLITPETLPLLEPMLARLLDLGVRDILLLRYKGPDARMRLDAAQLELLVAALTAANGTGLSYRLSRDDWRWVLGSPRARTLKPPELDAVVALILELNRQPEQHCLDCPDEADALRAALTTPDTQVAVAAVDRRDTLLGALVVMGSGPVRRVWGRTFSAGPGCRSPSSWFAAFLTASGSRGCTARRTGAAHKLLVEMGRMTPD